MKKNKSNPKRWMVLALSAIMMATMIPGNAWAAETETVAQTYAETVESEVPSVLESETAAAVQIVENETAEAETGEAEKTGAEEDDSETPSPDAGQTDTDETGKADTTDTSDTADTNDTSDTAADTTETTEPGSSGESEGEGEDQVREIIPELELSDTSFVYNGEIQKPSVIVKDGDTVLDEENYTLLYDAESVDVGIYNISVELKGDYAGKKTASYEIIAKAITPTVTLSKTSFVYNGKEQKPTVTVADGVTTLESSDYTVTYANGRINTGTYKVTVKMKGNYSGTKTVNYKITAKAITPAVTLSKTSFVYNGKVQKPSVIVKTGSTKLTTADYTVTYSTGCKNVGAYKVTIKMRRNYSGSKSVTFKILPKGTALSTVKAGKNRMIVSWKKQATQTTGYHIQYSAKSDFSKALTATVASNATLSRSISSLTKGSTYYVRIRTFKTVGGTKYYSAWSAAKSVKITAGTTEKFGRKPSVSIGGDDFVNTISWKALSGASGYEVRYRKGSSGSWTILKRTTALKATQKVTHGVGYYYKVRAYKDKKDGSRIYGDYSNEVNQIQYYLPSFNIVTSDKTHINHSAFVMAVTNNGDYNLLIDSDGARLRDADYTNYDRDLQLVDTTLNPLSSQIIPPGKMAFVCFVVKGAPTWVDSRTRVYFDFKYDGIWYWGVTSHDYGTNYYKY